MSLVREALEKAEREAAARAAREKGLPGSLSGGAGPYRAPRRKRSRATRLAVGTLTLVALAAAGWFLTRPAARRTEAPAPSPSPTATTPESEAPVAPVVDAAPAGPAPAPPAPIAEPAAAPVPAGARQAATVPTRRTFLRRAALDGDRALELGGIAWSETTPLAYLNGRLRGVGEVVEGFRVDAIEPEAVELSGDAGRLRLTLR